MVMLIGLDFMIAKETLLILKNTKNINNESKNKINSGPLEAPTATLNNPTIIIIKDNNESFKFIKIL